jgi:flagellar hook protein FlgE
VWAVCSSACLAADTAASSTANRVVWTGSATDLAIRGEGYFLLKDPTSGELFVTRRGHFRNEADGFLTASGGLRLQGYNTPILSSQNYTLSSPVGDLMLDKGNPPSSLPTTAARAGINELAFDAAGRIRVVLTDRSEYVRGQVLLQAIANPFALVESEEGIYRVTAEARPLSPLAKPDAQRRRTIVTGALEVSP